MTVLATLADTLYAWDVALFQSIHTTAPPSAEGLNVARMFAEAPLWVTVLILAGMIMLPAFSVRLVALKAGILALAAVAINVAIGFVWYRPRPFVAGIGLGWIPHAATSSFPSDHLTVQWVVAGVLLLNKRTRLWGVALALLGLPMAWARIYLGDHYPGDILGAAAMGLLAALVAWRWHVSSASDEAFFGPRN